LIINTILPELHLVGLLYIVLCPIFTGGVSRKNLLTPPMKMEQRKCSEMLAHKIQMLGNHPKETTELSEHGGSLKSSLHLNCTGLKYVCGICCYVQTTFSENWVFVTTHEEALNSFYSSSCVFHTVV